MNLLFIKIYYLTNSDLSVRTNLAFVTFCESNAKILLTSAVASIKSIIAPDVPSGLPCVTAGDGCDGYLHTATAIIRTVTAVTNCHGQPIESEVQSCVRRECGYSCKQCRTH